jgi:hypothetical protein
MSSRKKKTLTLSLRHIRIPMLQPIQGTARLIYNIPIVIKNARSSTRPFAHMAQSRDEPRLDDLFPTTGAATRELEDASDRRTSNLCLPGGEACTERVQQLWMCEDVVLLLFASVSEVRKDIGRLRPER